MKRVPRELIELMHRKLDGEDLSGEEQIRLRMGLAGSSEAREILDGLSHVQRELQHLPKGSFPDSALEQILARTSRSRVAPGRSRAAFGSRFGSHGLRWASLAAAVALLAVALWSIRAPQPEPAVATQSDADAQAEAQAEEALAELQTVFRLTSNAIDRSTAAALGDVVREEVSPALRKIPVRFPAATPAEGGGS